MSRTEGKICSWNDDRGFGFITPHDGGEKIFLHISAFGNRTRRPMVNDSVTFRVAYDKQHRPHAERVTYSGGDAGNGKSLNLIRAMVIATSYGFLVYGLAVKGRLPLPMIYVIAVASFLAFVLYAWDKFSATRSLQRTSESTLHILGLVGGWPGALIARHLFRHKSSKQPFIRTFWITVVLNSAAVTWLLTPEGQRQANVLMSLLNRG